MSSDENTSFIDEITCDFVKTLTPYESARRLFSGGKYWLNANESPFSNAVQLDSSRLNRYPDCQPNTVVNAYAEYANVSKEQVLVSRGADEGIELLIRAFCTPGEDHVLICPPTYGMYAISAQTCHVGVDKAPLNTDFCLDFEALKVKSETKTLPKIVFLCSPNNPTGTSLPQADIEQVLRLFAGKSLVVVDEAYIEFDASNTQSQLLAKFNNLVILRTLSKAFALAGIRCGFTLASEDIIRVLLKVIAPYPISDPVAQIAAQALSDSGIAQMQQQVQFLEGEKQFLKSAFATLPDTEIVGAQQANFILFKSSNKQAIMNFLVENGMLIRDQSKQLHLADCLRITIGNREENQRLIDLMKQFYLEGKAA